MHPGIRREAWVSAGAGKHGGRKQNMLAASSPVFQLCYSPVVLETFFFVSRIK